MTIENQRNIYRIWLRKMITTLVFTISILLVLFTGWFENPDWVINKYHVIIAIAVIYFGLGLINYFRDPYYLHFQETEEMLIVRYYPVSIFNKRKNSIEIPKKLLVTFRIERFFLGIEERLILYQHYRNKVAKYPPISLSAVDKADRRKLREVLTRYSKK